MRRPSPALVVACIALLVALTGTSYATVMNVPKNSVGTSQMKRNAVKARQLAPNAVRTAHVLNGSLLAADFKAGQLPAGAKGDKGDKGDKGAPGPVGISGREVVRVSTIVAPNTQSSAQAACPSGKKVLGGAASIQGVPTGVSLHTQVTEAGTFSAYDAIFTNTSAIPRQLNATAICATVGG